MQWTGEDTKDVFKKVIGGLIAAAVLALVYAIVERAEWYYAAATGIVLIVLVFVLVFRFSRQSATRVERPQTAEPPPVEPQQPQHSATAPSVPSDAVERRSDDEKVMKKAIKAEQKRRKKEAKAREKDD